MSVQLVFSRNKGLISRLVCFFTRSEFSHVDLYDPKSNTVIGSIAPAGVREIPLQEMLTSCSKAVVKTMSNIDDKKILAYARSKIGAKYDWTAMLGFIFRQLFDNPSRYFCSELVVLAFTRAGYPIVNDEFHIKPTPDFLYGLEGFGKVKMTLEILPCGQKTATLA